MICLRLIQRSNRSRRTRENTLMGSANVPTRLESRGSLSKASTPCISARSWKRSMPVACCSSVGTSPGFAPGPNRAGAWWSERAAEVLESARTALMCLERVTRRAAGRTARREAENMTLVEGGCNCCRRDREKERCHMSHYSFRITPKTGRTLKQLHLFVDCKKERLLTTPQ